MNTLIQRREALRRRCAGSFDIIFRDITVDALQGTMVFLSSLTDARLLSAISESFVISAANTLQLTLYPAAVEAIYEEETAMVSLLSGQCLVRCWRGMHRITVWKCAVIHPVPTASLMWSAACEAHMTASWRTSSSTSVSSAAASVIPVCR